MLGGVVTMLVELGRELDLALTNGSIERARGAAHDSGVRDEIRSVIEAVEARPLPDPS